MAKRPENHIIGEVAINNIKTNLLPKGWIVNEHSKDYGLDLHVQVCVDNCSTNNCFYIQSKGTETVSKNGEISYEMSLERLLDYKDMPLPVLIVYYSIPESTFWGIWANGIYDTLTEDQKEQKKYNIRFTPSNIIDTAYLESIGERISSDQTNRIDIRTYATEPEQVRLHLQLFKLLEKQFPGKFSMDNRIAYHAVYLNYKHNSEGVSIQINDKREEINVPIGQIDSSFLWYPEITIDESPFGIQVFVGSMGMLYVDKKSPYPYDIYSKEIIEALFPILPGYYWLDWVYNVPIERIGMLEHVVCLSVRPENKATTQFVQIALLFRSEQEIEPLRVKHFQEMIDNAETPQEKGHMCYNLANNMRAKNCHESMSLYLQAAKHFPEYLKVYYWWKEVAGVLFMTGHYFFSRIFYEKALSLSKDIDVKREIVVLIADTCLYQKDIKRAREWLGKYFDYCAEDNSTVPPKVLLLAKVYELLDDIVEKRGWICSHGDAWFDEGLRCHKAGKYADALDAFLIAWAYRDTDYEALQGALAMAIRVGHALYVAFVLETIRTTCSKREINAIVDEIIKWQLPEESENGLLTILNGEIPKKVK